MEDSDTNSIREHLAPVLRHKLQIAVVAISLGALAIAVALGLPAIYRSSAIILVQEQEVPPDLVRSTVTSFADERIQVISQRIMTRQVLLPLSEKYGLYEKYRKRETNEQIVDRMRKDITLTTVDANVSDRTSGRRVNATIAFQLSYDSAYPDRAQRVVEDLVALYLAENVKARQESVAETTTFLAQEADRVSQQLQEIEGNLADFKRRYEGRTPDLWEVNRQTTERNAAELLRIDREVNIVQDRKSTLEAQLQLVSPTLLAAAQSDGQPVLSPKDRLRVLEAEYAKQSTIYRHEFPDMRRLAREIAAVKEEIDASALSGGQAGGRQPDNPAYVALTTQLANAKRELENLAVARKDLREQQSNYQAWLTQMPEIEREYKDLTRDYENAKTRYHDVKAKQMDAEVAQVLEKDRKAERFSVGEPATLPTEPTKPKRLQIMMIGLIGAVSAGIGLAWLRDMVDPAIKGPLALARIAQVPVLTPIPYIGTLRERAQARRRDWIFGSAFTMLWSAVTIGAFIFLSSR